MDLVGSDHCEDQNPDVDISTSSNRMSEPAEIIIEYEHTFTSTDAKIGHSTPKRKRNESMSAAVRDGGLKRLTSPQSDNCDVLSISSTTVTASECNISNNSDTVLARNDSSITLSASSLSATVTASSDDEPRELPSISGKMTRHRQIMQQRSKMHKHVWNISGKTVGSAEKTIASLKKKIKNLQQQNRRLKSKVYSQQSLMEYLRETCGLTPNAGLVLNASVDDGTKEILKRFIKGKSKQKYNASLRAFALTLHFYSSKAYDFVREQFNKSLPHPHTLIKWYQRINGAPGFSMEAKNNLLCKVQTEQKHGRKVLCNLVMDSMAIRRRIEWNGQKWTGYIDLGFDMDGDKLPEVKEALVMMLVAINGKWKLPVGYFFINGLSGEEQANLVSNLLTFIHDTGVIICSVTFDGASQNISMIKHLGADLKIVNLKTWFPHPVDSHRVYVYLDPCHMLKLIRNCLATYKNFKTDQNELVSWEYFEKLVNIQNNEGLRAATKIKERHVKWENEKMKVCLAAQTFSKSVADALRFLETDLGLKEFEGASATANFAEMINNIFDIFNSNSRYSKYEFKQGLDVNNAQQIFVYLEQCKTYFEGLKTETTPVLQCRRKTGFLGFLICMASLQQFYLEYVIEFKYLNYILTYKLSQDHIELFFSAVRSKGGCNNNPTARQFESIFKRLLLHCDIKGSKYGNVVSLDNTSILGTTYINTLTKTNCGNILSENDDYMENTTEVLIFGSCSLHLWQLTPYVCDIVAYISGFVVKNLKKCVSCHECLLLMESSETRSLLQKRKQCGNLTRASNYVIKVCEEGERSVRSLKAISSIFSNKLGNIEKYLVSYTLRKLNTSIFEVFGDHVLDDSFENNHSLQLTKMILAKYIRLRLHHESNLASEFGRRYRSDLTKSILFRNQ
ncbi:unnamed protein product [Acanthoscelides obtectus]|uniref:THAP domain-containing protein 9 n=1 Tax=Acanthoscelides obtectus TaxID=200917 RepID=A0A9P0K8H2_ACAOB|nr:unnamed protein product [Acanthoscelides obtectus]CAK1662522.1 DNA transposase THAP9 [Acanthoscelides obtectus]